MQCAQCHVNSNYSLTNANAACVSCHLKDFQGATQPNHVQSNFSQTCTQCHNTTTWTGAKFDHSTTGFPLTGVHTTIQCAQCHVNSNYNLTSANTTCVSCHLKDFQGTTNPNHVAGGFPQTCEQCHNTHCAGRRRRSITTPPGSRSRVRTPACRARSATSITTTT